MKFGYKMINGKYVVNACQVEIINQSMEDYIGGKSLKQKAEELTELGIEYAIGKHQWNKNRVQRMLTDACYLGDDNYPQVVSEELFNVVKRVMQSRNTLKNFDREEAFSSTIVPIRCGKCGEKTRRRYVHKKESSQVIYYCQRPECRKSYIISNDSMRKMVRDRMSSASERVKLPSKEVNVEIQRLNNEIERDLCGQEIDVDTLKNKIFMCASLQYSTCILKRESKDYSHIDPCSPDFIREIKRRVSVIYLNADNEIWLKMTDGQIIGKEEMYYATDNSDK